MKKQNPFVLLAVVLSATLSACSTPRGVPDAQGVSFPPREASYRSDGIVVPRDTVRLLQPGLSKDQVRQLIGNPHFTEGLFAVRDWNYILKLPGDDTGLVECQFQLQFDEQGKVRSRHWQTEACAAAEASSMVKVAGAAPAAASAGARTVEDTKGDRWSEDGLVFPFGRSSLDDLRAADRARLKALVARTVREAGSVQRIVVVGHADRIGTVQRKQSRALDRAQAVAAAFAAKGIDPGMIEVVGRSDAEPLSACPTRPPLSELLACLTPDRRVSVIVYLKAG